MDKEALNSSQSNDKKSKNSPINNLNCSNSNNNSNYDTNNSKSLIHSTSKFNLKSYKMNNSIYNNTNRNKRNIDIMTGNNTPTKNNLLTHIFSSRENNNNIFTKNTQANSNIISNTMSNIYKSNVNSNANSNVISNSPSYTNINTSENYYIHTNNTNDNKITNNSSIRITKTFQSKDKDKGRNNIKELREINSDSNFNKNTNNTKITYNTKAFNSKTNLAHISDFNKKKDIKLHTAHNFYTNNHINTRISIKRNNDNNKASKNRIEQCMDNLFNNNFNNFTSYSNKANILLNHQITYNSNNSKIKDIKNSLKSRFLSVFSNNNNNKSNFGVNIKESNSNKYNLTAIPILNKIKTKTSINTNTSIAYNNSANSEMINYFQKSKQYTPITNNNNLPNIDSISNSLLNISKDLKLLQINQELVSTNLRLENIYNKYDDMFLSNRSKKQSKRLLKLKHYNNKSTKYRIKNKQYYNNKNNLKRKNKSNKDRQYEHSNKKINSSRSNKLSTKRSLVSNSKASKTDNLDNLRERKSKHKGNYITSNLTNKYYNKSNNSNVNTLTTLSSYYSSDSSLLQEELKDTVVVENDKILKKKIFIKKQIQQMYNTIEKVSNLENYKSEYYKVPEIKNTLTSSSLDSYSISKKRLEKMRFGLKHNNNSNCNNFVKNDQNINTIVSNITSITNTNNKDTLDNLGSNTSREGNTNNDEIEKNDSNKLLRRNNLFYNNGNYGDNAAIPKESIFNIRKFTAATASNNKSENESNTTNNITATNTTNKVPKKNLLVRKQTIIEEYYNIHQTNTNNIYNNRNSNAINTLSNALTNIDIKKEERENPNNNNFNNKDSDNNNVNSTLKPKKINYDPLDLEFKTLKTQPNIDKLIKINHKILSNYINKNFIDTDSQQLYYEFFRFKSEYYSNVYFADEKESKIIKNIVIEERTKNIKLKFIKKLFKKNLKKAIDYENENRNKSTISSHVKDNANKDKDNKNDLSKDEENEISNFEKRIHKINVKMSNINNKEKESRSRKSVVASTINNNTINSGNDSHNSISSSGNNDRNGRNVNNKSFVQGVSKKSLFISKKTTDKENDNNDIKKSEDNVNGVKDKKSKSSFYNIINSKYSNMKIEDDSVINTNNNEDKVDGVDKEDNYIGNDIKNSKKKLKVRSIIFNEPKEMSTDQDKINLINNKKTKLFKSSERRKQLDMNKNNKSEYLFNKDKNNINQDNRNNKDSIIGDVIDANHSNHSNIINKNIYAKSSLKRNSFKSPFINDFLNNKQSVKFNLSTIKDHIGNNADNYNNNNQKSGLLTSKYVIKNKKFIHFNSSNIINEEENKSEFVLNTDIKTKDNADSADNLNIIVNDINDKKMDGENKNTKIDFSLNKQYKSKKKLTNTNDTINPTSAHSAKRFSFSDLIDLKSNSNKNIFCNKSSKYNVNNKTDNLDNSEISISNSNFKKEYSNDSSLNDINEESNEEQEINDSHNLNNSSENSNIISTVNNQTKKSNLKSLKSIVGTAEEKQQESNKRNNDNKEQHFKFMKQLQGLITKISTMSVPATSQYNI